MIYKVDYLIKDKAAYDAAPVKVPKYIVCDSFVSALKTASKYETENLSLAALEIADMDGNVAVARGFKGV